MNIGEATLFLIKVKKVAGTHFQRAGKLEDVVEANILFPPLYFTHEVAVSFDHFAQLFLGNASLFAQRTQTFAER